jgi:hypothetical protein
MKLSEAITEAMTPGTDLHKAVGTLVGVKRRNFNTDPIWEIVCRLGVPWGNYDLIDACLEQGDDSQYRWRSSPEFPENDDLTAEEISILSETLALGLCDDALSADLVSQVRRLIAEVTRRRSA